MLSRTGTYALQATLYLAKSAVDQPVSAAQMAEALDVPPNYLAKVLRELGRAGVLESTRGAHGGYRLTGDPAGISVAELVEPFDAIEPPKSCLMGGKCDLSNPCSAHMRRLEWIESHRQLLRDTSLQDLLTQP